MNNIQNEIDTLRNYGISPGFGIPSTRKEVLAALSALSEKLDKIDLSLQERREVYTVIEPFTHMDLSKGLENTLNKIKRLVSSFPSFTEKVAHDCTEKIISSNREDTKKIDQEMQSEKRSISEEYSLVLDDVLSGKHETSTPETLKEIILETRSKHPRPFMTPQEELQKVKKVFQKKLTELDARGTSIEKERLAKFMKFFKDDLFSLEKPIQAAIQGGGSTLTPTVTSLDDPSIKSLQNARMYRLEHVEQTYQESLQDPSGQVFTKYFPDTFAWCVGIFQPDGERSPLQVEMQRIASVNGIILITERNSTIMNQSWTTHPNQLLLECGKIYVSYLNAFSFQDGADFCVNGTVKIPRPHVIGFQPGQLDDAIFLSRNLRSKAYATSGRNIDILGAVHANQFSTKAVALASSLGASTAMNLTYNEGGNTLIGQTSSGPYVIIGKDSYAASKFLMERDLGRTMTHEEVCKAFAIDYGIDVKSVFFVEQPGDFHLDMSMAIVGEKTILLNDSEKAQELFEKEQIAWLQKLEDACTSDLSEFDLLQAQVAVEVAMLFIEEERQNVPIRKQLEDETQKDLERQGFTVIRVPGRFNYSARSPAMNLFNMVTATTPEGKKIVVMLGCINKEYEETFKAIIRANCPFPIDEFYVLNVKSSQDSEVYGGGISCRTKTIGYLPSSEKKGA